MQTAVPLPNADPVAQGAGLINLHRAREAKLSTVADAVQTWPRSTGLGSLQLARGSVVTEDDGTIEGEQTIFGDTWDAATWAASSWDGTSWSGGLDRQDVVGRLLVWLELERAYVVRSHLERFVMVGQDVERKDVVGSHLERIRLVGRLVGRGRRSLVPVLGRLGKHHLGGLDASAPACRPRSHAAECLILTTALFAVSVLLWFAVRGEEPPFAGGPSLRCGCSPSRSASRKCS